MQLVQRATHILIEYGPTSSLHGLYHTFQAGTALRRWLWLIIFLAAISVGIFHTALLANRYLSHNSFVHVNLSRESMGTDFPEITLCKMKPFSESLLLHDSEMVDKYFSDKWGYFDSWFVHERQRRPSELDIDYKKRMKALFARLLRVVWVSEDIKELGLIGSMDTILHCSWGGRPCDHRNFTVLRDPDSWHCYNFAPRKDLSTASKGLTLLLFTDSNFFHPIMQGSMVNHNKQTNVSSADFTHLANISKMNSLMYFLGSGAYQSLNQIAAPSTFQAGGFQVIVHEPGSHPMMSLHRLELEAGMSGTVNVQLMKVQRMQQPGRYDCAHPPYKQIQYVANFDSNGFETRRDYNKLLDDHVVEAKQALVYKECGCYSHKYPFQSTVQSLCYFVPPESRRLPPADMMSRMDCHDRVVASADHDTNRLMSRFKGTEPCNSMVLTFSNNIFGWPKNEDISSIVNIYLMKKLINGTDSDNRTNGAQDTLGSKASHQKAVLNLLFNQNCSNDTARRGQPIEDFWCLSSNERLKRNLLKLHIKHLPQHSKLAKEHFGFQWPEALSEVGGICGLWLGMSVLTVFEIIEALVRPTVT